MKNLYSLFAIAAFAFTAQAQTEANFIFNDQGYTNAQDVTTGNIVAGKITFEALKNTASNGPKFYTGGGGTLRMYSHASNGNTLEIKSIASDSKFNVVRIVTTGKLGEDDYAPTTAVIKVDGVVVPTVRVKTAFDNDTYLIEANAASSIIIQNNAPSSSQIRIKSISINQNLSVSDINATKVSLVKNTVVANEIMFAEKANVSIINMNGQVVRTADVNKGTSLNVSDLTKGIYVVTATVNGKAVSQKIIKK